MRAVTNDLWIAGYRTTTPVGTHHSVLTISASSTRTGDYDCSAEKRLAPRGEDWR